MRPLKSFDINDYSVRWDAFQQLHQFTDHRLVIHFQTGEMCVTTRHRCRMGRGDYKFYPQRNVYVLNTNDMSPLNKGGIRLLDPGTQEPIKPAWLNSIADPDTKRSQLLLVDMDHLMAVCVSAPDQRDQLPPHIRRAGGVYYASAQAKPVGNTIRVSRPSNPSDDERAQVKQLMTAVKAWASLSGLAETHQTEGRYRAMLAAWETDKATTATHNQSFNQWLRHHPVPHEDALSKPFAEMSATMRTRLYLYGVRIERAVKLYDHLTVAVSPQ